MLPLFSESLERPLSIREKTLMRLHLFVCEACRRYVGQIEQMSVMLKPEAEEEIPAAPAVKLSSDARERIRTALETAARRKN